MKRGPYRSGIGVKFGPNEDSRFNVSVSQLKGRRYSIERDRRCRNLIMTAASNEQVVLYRSATSSAGISRDTWLKSIVFTSQIRITYQKK